MPLFAVATTVPPNLSFDGQTILITGGSSGLGFETAIHYVQLGASTVIITARDKGRGAQAVADIEARTGRKGVVQVRALDMNTFGYVKRFVDELKRDFKTIDVVLLNAGIINFKHEKSPDGWEIDMQVNVLSTALLALLLLPWMQAVKRPGKPQHLGIVASGMFKYANILSKEFPKYDVLKYFNDEQHYTPGQPSYALTKLFVQYVAAEIAKLATAPDGRYVKPSMRPARRRGV
jgi:NAD(P)-dependent dehydrogenase (short-subunit alcohol dehydrogenase family)